jgi:hypothetical protein
VRTGDVPTFLVTSKEIAIQFAEQTDSFVQHTNDPSQSIVLAHSSNKIITKCKEDKASFAMYNSYESLMKQLNRKVMFQSIGWLTQWVDIMGGRNVKCALNIAIRVPGWKNEYYHPFMGDEDTKKVGMCSHSRLYVKDVASSASGHEHNHLNVSLVAACIQTVQANIEQRLFNSKRRDEVINPCTVLKVINSTRGINVFQRHDERNNTHAKIKRHKLFDSGNEHAIRCLLIEGRFLKHEPEQVREYLQGHKLYKNSTQYIVDLVDYYRSGSDE